MKTRIIIIHTHIIYILLLLLQHLPVQGDPGSACEELCPLQGTGLSRFFIFFFNETLMLSEGKADANTAWHQCCHKEIALDCLRDFRSGSEFRVFLFFYFLDQLPPSAIEHSLSCYLPIAFEKTQGHQRKCKTNTRLTKLIEAFFYEEGIVPILYI